jgi:hypothetical protein
VRRTAAAMGRATTAATTARGALGAIIRLRTATGRRRDPMCNRHRSA